MKHKTDEERGINISIPLDSAISYINERAKVDIGDTANIIIDVNPLKLPKGVNLKEYYYSYCEESYFPKWNLRSLYVPVTPENHKDIAKEDFTYRGKYVQNLVGGILFFALRTKIMEIKNMARQQYEDMAKIKTETLEVETDEGIKATNILEKQTQVGFAQVGNE